mmetsp:Transcript_68340/g.189107  ORF Transcript_68340/g.189107 Transcript_68340/m.189107 type:complete len:252 (+) Transcript_68340:419-1174(+)
MAAGRCSEGHTGVVRDAKDRHAAVAPRLAGTPRCGGGFDAGGGAGTLRAAHDKVDELQGILDLAVAPDHILHAPRGATTSHVRRDDSKACKQELTLGLAVLEVPGLPIIDQVAQWPTDLEGSVVPSKLHDARHGLLAPGWRRWQQDIHGNVHAVGHAHVGCTPRHARGVLLGLVARLQPPDAELRVPMLVRVLQVVEQQPALPLRRSLGATAPLNARRRDVRDDGLHQPLHKNHWRYYQAQRGHCGQRAQR